MYTCLGLIYIFHADTSVIESRQFKNTLEDLIANHNVIRCITCQPFSCQFRGNPNFAINLSDETIQSFLAFSVKYCTLYLVSIEEKFIPHVEALLKMQEGLYLLKYGTENEMKQLIMQLSTGKQLPRSRKGIMEYFCYLWKVYKERRKLS